MRVFGVVIACAFASATFGVPLASQPLPASEPSLAPAELAEESVRQEIETLRYRWVGTARVRASYPLRFSAGIGALLSKQAPDHECSAVCQYRGMVVQLEPGIVGGQLGIGYARIVGDRRRGSPILSDVYVGWGLRATLLRSWQAVSFAPTEQTLAGLEGQFTIARVGFSLGVLRRLAADYEGDQYVITGGIGWGF